MGRTSAARPRVSVTVVGPGIDPRPVSLPAGATVADVVRAVNGPPANFKVLIDGTPIEEVTPLKSGMTISLVPLATRPTVNRTWRDSVGTVQDTPEFREMIALGRAIRDADDVAESEMRIDQDDA